ncbi:unnamed protein product [Protopolystoma xenopodis]|uniref:PH domain-containing protein n=1 Tax=Protopolystoma xenopodis TaxID=117903 RepID=A0A448XAL3_9PLAT|nr:unnamed protein product [Protopolystoma xenopodis]
MHDDWVPCQVHLLSDDTDTFLCIKSKPIPLSYADEDNRSTLSDFSLTNTISSRLNSSSRPFTALCNLSQYKSCCMRTVSVHDKALFALKLVPAGVLGNKKLFLATDNENELTTWLSICKPFVGKRGKSNAGIGKDSYNVTGTLSHIGSQDTLKVDCESTFDQDFEGDLMDNEVYEPYSSGNFL